MLSVYEAHQHAVAAPPMSYDQRLAVAMTAQQFEAYKAGSGHTYYCYLNSLVKVLQPRHVLELGTSIGRSALFMMLGLPLDSKLTTIEVGSYQRGDLRHFFADPRLRIVYGSDTDQSVYDTLGLQDIDFMFMDSDHTYEQISQEWNIYRNFLSNGAIVVVDDIHLNEGLEHFWNMVPYDKIDTGNHLHFSGFGLFQFRK